MGKKSKAKVDYKSSGVDVEAGDAFVDWIQEKQKVGKQSPHSKQILSGVGGFASLFRADFRGMKKPCLVTCTDGVGTKVKLAAKFKRFEGIGQDLVAMCVNDLICTGGRPLMFLDYYAVGKLDLKDAKSFLKSVKEACDKADCALVGGETAEMPGVYQPGDFDCAGFAVGVVDEVKILGAHKVKNGDQVIGVSSSGFHSNGYSLLRKVFEKDLEKHVDTLLEPTALYVNLMAKLRKSRCDIHAVAHITGGGIENIPRVMPKGSVLKLKLWKFPKPFQLVQERTRMTTEQMLKTLNCGVGFVIMTSPKVADKVFKVIKECGFESYDLGVVECDKSIKAKKKMDNSNDEPKVLLPNPN